MPSVLVDRVKIVVLSNGTGSFVLGGASRSYRGVEALADGATYSYAVEFGPLFEVGTGTYDQTARTLSRAVEQSSSAGGLVEFPTGVEVAFTALADDFFVGADVIADVEDLKLGIMYADKSVTITQPMVDRTQPVLPANPLRRGLILQPPASPCGISFHPEQPTALVSALGYDRAGNACPLNAIYQHGLALNAIFRIEEGQ